MSLSEVQMAAALCEQVYRRADNDQQLDSSEDGNGGFGIELLDPSTRVKSLSVLSGAPSDHFFISTAAPDHMENRSITEVMPMSRSDCRTGSMSGWAYRASTASRSIFSGSSWPMKTVS